MLHSYVQIYVMDEYLTFHTCPCGVIRLTQGSMSSVQCRPMTIMKRVFLYLGGKGPFLSHLRGQAA